MTTPSTTTAAEVSSQEDSIANIAGTYLILRLFCVVIANRKAKHKNLKKLRNTVLWFLACLVLLALASVVSIYWVLGTEAGERFLTRQANAQLVKYFPTKAEVGLVELEFPLRLKLHDVRAYDFHDELFMEVGYLEAVPAAFQADSQLVLLHFEELILDRPFFKMHEYPGEEDFDFQLVFAAMAGAKDQQQDTVIQVQTESSAAFKLKVDRIYISNGVLASESDNRPKKELANEMDYYHFSYNIDTSYIENFTVDPAVQGNVCLIKFSERSGFTCESFSGDVRYDRDSLSSYNTSIVTAGTSARFDVVFHHKDGWAWKEFEERVVMKARFRPSQIRFSDVAYYARELDAFDHEISLSGDFEGAVNDFRARQVKLGIGKRTELAGSFSITGLPDYRKAFINLRLEESNVYPKDARYVFDKLSIPSFIDRLGYVKANGRFTGFFTDFVAYAEFNTALGKVETDIKLVLAEEDRDNRYKGRLKLHGFDLGTLTGNESIGRIKMDGQIDGKGFLVENARANLEADLDYFEVLGYRYSQLQAKGLIVDQFFEGELNMRDRNALLDFSGSVDFRNKRPKFDFKAQVDSVKLHELGLVADTSYFRGIVDFDLSGNNLDDFQGSAKARDFQLNINQREFIFDDFLFSSRVTYGMRFWNFQSDVFDFDTKGRFSAYNVLDIILSELSRFAHQDYKPTAKLKGDEVIDFSAIIKNPFVIKKIFLPDFDFAEDTRASGTINLAKDSSDITLSSDRLAYGPYVLKEVGLSFKSLKQSGEASISVDQAHYQDSLIIDSLAIQVGSRNDSLFFDSEIRNRPLALSLGLKGNIDMLKPDSHRISLTGSKLLLNDTTWLITGQDVIWLNGSQFNLQGLRISSGDQAILVKGANTPEKAPYIRVGLNNLSFTEIAHLTPAPWSEASGTLNGGVDLQWSESGLLFDADIEMAPFAFSMVQLARLGVQSAYSKQSNKANLSVVAQDTLSKSVLDGYGYIDYNGDPSLALIFSLTETDLAFLSSALQGYVSDVQGSASGKLKISGPLESPDVSGTLSVQDAEFNVDYLGTRYSLSHQFAINKQTLLIKDLAVRDMAGEKSVCNGYIRHSLFTEFYLDLNFLSKNFYVLKTEEGEESFYGTVLASGRSKFVGPLDRMDISLDVMPEKGTQLFIPIEDGTDNIEQGFIKILDPDKGQGAPKFLSEVKGLNMVINIDANTNGEVQLVFDKRLGDIIRSRGNGQIKFTMSRAGEFRLFGDYVIEEGDYLFTAFDLLNKKFVIQNGGQISWTGDPYGAEIDIQAIYKLKANALFLVQSLPQMQTQDLEPFRTPVPVEASAHLSGSLNSPNILLDYRFEEFGASNLAYINRQLQNLKQSREEVNKQVVSLLVLNRFMPVNSGLSGNEDLLGAGLNSGLGDLVSNQISYWLSQINDDFQVNLKYRDGMVEDGNVLTQQELELALSTTLFNDRVSVSGAYEFQNSYQPNFEVSYKVTEDGKVKVKVFNRQSLNPLINQSSTTSGAGIFFKKEFDRFGELFGKKEEELTLPVPNTNP